MIPTWCSAGCWSLVVVLAACGPGGLPEARDPAVVRTEVTAALERYMVAARAVDPDAIAASFAPTGILFEPGIFPIESRDSIRAFVASFPGVRVESATAVPDTIEVFGNTAYVWGSYHERLVFPGQPRSEQDGRFVIEWIRGEDGAWLIQRYFRVPVPSPTRASSPRGP